MDAALFVLVPRNFAPLIADALSSETNDVAREGVQVRRCELTEGLWRFLPQHMVTADYDSYLVDDESLMMFEAAENGCIQGEEAEEYRPALPRWLLQRLTDAKTWIVAFLWHWDQISAVEQSTPTEAVERLRRVLHWDEKREGFIVYYP